VLLSCVNAGYVQDALKKTAIRGNERMLSAAYDAIKSLNTVGSARKTAIASSDCTADGSVGCCPMQTQLAAVASSSTICQSLASFDTSASPPDLTDGQIALACSSSCITDANNVFLGFDNVTNPTGCASVTGLHVFSDLLCMRDFDNGQYCYNTLKTLIAFRNTTVNTTNLVITLCSNCGRQIFNYLFNLPPLEKQVLGVERFLPVVQDKLPFICATDPDDDERCLENDNKRSDARNPCKFCGRSAVRAGADDLDLDLSVEPLLNCGCAERSRGRSCLDLMVSNNISYFGNGSIGQTFPSNDTSIDGVEDDFTPCYGVMTGQDTVCSPICQRNLQHIFNDIGCCSSCLLLGFNISVHNGTLPDDPTVLNRLITACGNNVVASDAFDACETPKIIGLNLTIHNLKYSWYTNTSNMNQINSAVDSAVAKAAGCSQDAVHLVQVVQGGENITFEYEFNITSENQGRLMAKQVSVVSAQGMLDLKPIEDLAVTDLSAAVYNLSNPINTNVTIKDTSSTSGALSVAAFSSVFITAMLSVAAAVLW